jgi:hypothetical protein
MQLSLEWSNAIPLIDGRKQNLIYVLDWKRLPDSPGVYVFGRQRRNGGFEALYVGRAANIRSRVWSHRNNLRLMVGLEKAKQGKLLVRAGVLKMRDGPKLKRSLPIIERALIRYFLSEGHGLVNKAGTLLRRHEISSVGKHPNQFIPRLMFVDRERGE